MNQMPQISVLMPVFDGENYIYDSIKSILDQTYSDFELLILLEYGSNKKSRDIVYSFSDTRIRVIENLEKLGLAASLNRGIELSRGIYIARMDADDVSYPRRFELQKQYLDKHKDISLCGTAVKINGKYCLKKMKGHNEIVFSSYLECPFFHPTVMWRKKDFMGKNLLYKENIAAEDYELWMRVVEQCKTANIQRPLLMYRLYGNSRSDAQREKLIAEDDVIRSEYWTRNGLRYEADERFISIFKDSEIYKNEWRLYELARKTGGVRHKKQIVQKLALDLYMKETYSISKIYNRYCELFLFLYNYVVLAKIEIFSYCIFRVAKRNIRLLIERILRK